MKSSILNDLKRRSNTLLLRYGREIKLLLFLATILLLIIALSPMYLPFAAIYYEHAHGQPFSEMIANDIKKENQTETVLEIIKWVGDQDNIRNIWGHQLFSFGNIAFIDIFPFFCIRTFHDTPTWVLFTRCGACEENALIFAEIAKHANLTVRSIHSHGEDHNWDEVFIDGKWITVDVSCPNGTCFDVDPFFYDRAWGNRSYIYAIYPNGSKTDVTDRYTYTGNITVKISDDSPFDEVTVVVKKSFFGSELTECHTKPGGLCNFSIGGNIYSISAFAGPLNFFADEEIVKNYENETHAVGLSPEIFDKQLLLFIAYPLLFALLAFYVVLRKRASIKS